MSNSLWPHGLQHTRVPCRSLFTQSLFKLMSIELVMPSNHLILCCHLFLLSSSFPGIMVFYNKLASYILWPKYWSFSISPSSECSGLIFLTCASWQLLLEAREQGHFSSNSFLLFQVFFLSWSNSGSDLTWTLSFFLNWHLILLEQF